MTCQTLFPEKIYGKKNNISFISADFSQGALKVKLTH